MPGQIVIKGARVHNLKNIDLEIPRDRLVVITGVFTAYSPRQISFRSGIASNSDLNSRV